MKIVSTYTGFIEEFEKSKNLKKAVKSHPDLENLFIMAEEWGIDAANVETWLKSKEYEAHKKIALSFIERAPEVVKRVEDVFGSELPGEVRLSPSFMRFDGFARYDHGSHRVLFGVDHPDADGDYLKVLMAHELSHVFRDHQPEVWGFLGKPLKEVSRQEYLDASTGEEHLVSEGLATLFSQIVYPEVPLHVHHYYFPDEMKWCLENTELIGRAIRECLKTDKDVWKFYSDDVVAPGSPSRVQYYWGAKKIREWLEEKSGDLQKQVVHIHGLPTKDFKCFE